MKIVPADCPKKLTEIMIKCWNSNPKMRPTFGEIVREIKDIVL